MRAETCAFPFLRKDGCGSALNRITCAIELGAVAAGPEWVKGLLGAVLGVADELFWNYGVGAAGAGEALRFFEKLRNSIAHSFRSVDFVYGTRNVVFLDKCLVGSIVENDRLVFLWRRLPMQ